MMEQGARQNPFQQLISECDNDPSKLQARYEANRSARNARFKSTILSPDFPGWTVDEILSRLHAQEKNEDDSKGEERFVDPRNNLAFYARPPQHIRELIDEIQQELKSVAPTIWFTPLDWLHMTVLEMANSQTAPEIEAIVSQLQGSDLIPAQCDYMSTHPPRLIKPVVNYDASAMALSFVPAAGEGGSSQPRSLDDDTYSYHHLRRDFYDRIADTGIDVMSRYITPSAHITIARFITQEGFLLEHPGSDGSQVDRGQLKALVEKIEHINQKLQQKYWPNQDRDSTSSTVTSKGEWLVGREKGVELCGGPSWYGEGKVFPIRRN